MTDDYGNDIHTGATLAPSSSGPTFGTIEQPGDLDWFKVTLQAWKVYTFGMLGGSATAGPASLAHPALRLFDDKGMAVEPVIDNSVTGGALLSYLAKANGTYYLQASSLQGGTGAYGVFMTGHDLPWDEVVNPPVFAIGSEIPGSIGTPRQTGWYAFELQAGTTYVFDLLADGAGRGTLGAGAGEARLRVLSDSGGGLAAVATAGVGGDPRVTYTPAENRTVYAQVSEPNDGGGTYTLKAWIGGSPARDVLADTPAADTLDGGAGLDTMRYAGRLADYAVNKNASGIQVAAKGGGAVDTLANIERIQFADSTLAFDAGGTAGQAYRLYQAAFDRAPDSAGLGYWIRMMDEGASVRDAAAAFAASGEFRSLYGDKPSNEALVRALYANVLHRAAEQAGYDYWKGVLDGGASVGDVLASFSEGAENQAALAAVIGNGFAYTPYG